MKVIWLIGCLLGLGVGLLGRAGLLASLGGEAVGKDASNYWSTVARIQEGVAARSKIALCGSSITGRLPGAAQGYPRVANFGSDGGSGADAVSMMAEGVLFLPEYLVFETNTLERYLTDGVKITIEPDGLWFRVGVEGDEVSAKMRPSKLLYSKFLGRRHILAADVQGFAVQSGPSVLDASSGSLSIFSDIERSRFDRLLSDLSYLQGQGCTIILVQYPSRPISEDFVAKQEFLISQLSSRLKLPFWDLQALVPADQVKLTDAVHMGPESAAKVLRLVEEYFGRDE